MRSPNVWKGQNSNECKNIRFCCKVFLHLIWFWHDPFWVRLKAMEGRVLQNRSRVCQNPFERVPLPRPNWTQLAWKHCTCILRNHKMVCPSHANDDQDLQNPLTRDLLRLNVARNSLSEVPSEALLQLKNLNQLDLSFNKIKVIAENTFAGE